jgi:orotate phosphoribosyltransferase
VGFPEVVRLARPRSGHFDLGTGYHGDLWLDLDALFLRPSWLRPHVRWLGERLREHEVDAVCGPLEGGAFLAYAVADLLGVAFLAGYRSPGEATGYRLPAVPGGIGGWRVAVVDDAVNAGTAVAACLEELRGRGAVPVAVAALVSLGEASAMVPARMGVPFYPASTVPSRAWPAERCPLCADGIPFTGLPLGTMTRPARSPSGVLDDPRIRLGIGIAGLLATAGAVRRDRVASGEARAFWAVNGLPDALYRPAWVVMQAGAFGAGPTAAAAAWLAGERELAGRLLAGGTGAWAMSKLVKQIVRRPRPAALLPGVRGRGQDAAGLGYLSGHAAVAVALGSAALPRLGPAGRAVTLTAVPLVGLTRVYVGAHLPLDVAGGAALGLAVEATAELILGR